MEFQHINSFAFYLFPQLGFERYTKKSLRTQKVSVGTHRSDSTLNCDSPQAVGQRLVFPIIFDKFLCCRSFGRGVRQKPNTTTEFLETSPQMTSLAAFNFIQGGRGTQLLDLKKKSRHGHAAVPRSRERWSTFQKGLKGPNLNLFFGDPFSSFFDL